MGQTLQMMKQLIPLPLRRIVRRVRSAGAVAAHQLDLLLNRALPIQIRRRRKESWEFEWQRDNWAQLYKDSQIKANALEYWRKFRYLGEILDRVPFTETTRVLDVGCGISTVLDFVPGRRVGIDPLADRYKSVYTYAADLDIQAGYGEAIPFPDNSFDVVFCSNSIDHHEHPERTVAEMQRVLKGGGHLILTCETFADDIGARNAGHPHSITTERLVAMVRQLELLEHWDSPWFGLRAYALGEGPDDSREQILLLRKP